MAGNIRRGGLIVASGEGKRIHVLGAEITVKIASSDTGGEFAVFEGETQPKQGPPLHLHRNEDEYWYVIDGEFLFVVDGQEIYASSGATVFAPRRSKHTFQNIGERVGRTLTTVIGGDTDVFFEELEALVPRGAKLDPAKVLPLFEKHGLELLGPPLAPRVTAVACGAD